MSSLSLSHDGLLVEVCGGLEGKGTSGSRGGRLKIVPEGPQNCLQRWVSRRTPSAGIADRGVGSCQTSCHHHCARAQNYWRGVEQPLVISHDF